MSRTKSDGPVTLFPASDRSTTEASGNGRSSEAVYQPGPIARLSAADYTSGDARPVLMSLELVDALGLTNRVNGKDATTGVVYLTEAELLAFGSVRVEWGEPDGRGWYTPTLYSQPVSA